MSEYIHKAHNVSVLLYHYVCPAKYRRVIFDDKVDKVQIQTCKEISKRYDINIMEIGTDGDHVHFLIQSVPMLAPTEIARIIKSITAREIYRLCPQVKKKLWGGNIWSAGYFVATVSEHGNEKQIQNYVRQQGKEYTKMYRSQIKLFDQLGTLDTAGLAPRQFIILEDEINVRLTHPKYVKAIKGKKTDKKDSK